jgi:hypothetical protein
MVYHLLFLDLQIKRYDFCKIGIKSGLKSKFEIVFNRELPCGVLLLVDTGLDGSDFWVVGSN